MSDAENDVVEMSFPKYGFGIDKWISYEANSHFTCPSDGFSFVLSRDSVDSTTLDALKRGEEFQIKVNGYIQANGYIDRVTTSASRESGTTLRIQGCDKLAQVVRAGIDPSTQFSDNQTLFDLLLKVFAPFGYSDPDTNFAGTNNDLNRDLHTGQVRGERVSKKGKPLKGYILHQSKPYHGEGAFAFASRISQRHGLWIWLSVVGGNVLAIQRPTFNQPPRYHLFAKKNGDEILTNIEHGTATEDSSQQPSCIVASGFTYGGEDDRSAMKVIVINELVALGPDGFATPEVTKIITDHPDASQLPPRSVFPPQALRAHPSAQPIYLKDQESQTLEELQNFARRELALRQKDALTVQYTVAGHSQDGCIYAVDTIVDVDDDVRDIHEPLWVMGRTFHKSVHGGTYTTLDLIRPHTLSFGDLEE